MIGSRLRYLLVLFGGGVFFLLYKQWLSFFVLLLLLILPILSLFLFLPTSRRCRLTMETIPTTMHKGEPIRFAVQIQNDSRLPLARAECRFVIENVLGTKEPHQICALSLPARSQRQAELSARSSYAGRIVCRMERACCWDFLGLFSHGLGPTQVSYAYIMPQIYPISPTLTVLPSTIFHGEDTDSTAAGEDPLETFELRTYRTGDPLRSVHWKSSARTEELIVRQFCANAACTVDLLVDLSGGLEGRDLLLDALASVHQHLEEHWIPHKVLWYDPVAGDLCHRILIQEGDWPPVLRELLLPPGPAGAALALLSSEDQPQIPPRILYFGSRLTEEDQARLARLSHALILVPAVGGTDLPAGVTVLRRETLTEALSALVI